MSEQRIDNDDEFAERLAMTSLRAAPRQRDLLMYQCGVASVQQPSQTHSSKRIRLSSALGLCVAASLSTFILGTSVVRPTSESTPSSPTVAETIKNDVPLKRFHDLAKLSNGTSKSQSTLSTNGTNLTQFFSNSSDSTEKLMESSNDVKTEFSPTLRLGSGWHSLQEYEI